MVWSKALAAGVLESSCAGTVVVDGEDRVVSANQAALAALGRDASWWGADIAETVGASRQGSAACAAWDLREWTDATGSPLVVLECSQALAVDGEDHVILTFVPAPASVLAADRATRSKTAFISSLSHELRTPLNALLGFAQLLEMDDLTSDQGEAVEQILSAGRHLLALISDTIDINRIEAGELPLRIETVEVGPLCDEVVALMSAEGARRGSRFEVVAAARTPVVLADRARLRQVLLNLVGNAVKYGGRDCLVTVQVGLTAGQCRIRVTDTGPGIDPRDAERIFEPFQRLSAAGPEVGTGLGLPLARSLTESMGGALTLEPSGAGGCAFCLVLPLAPHVDRVAPAAWELTEKVLGRVLYVEDNEGNARLVERLVQRRPGVVLEQVSTLEAARERLADQSYDAVLLDLTLPDGRGEDLIHGELAQSPHTTVVVMSGDAPSSELGALLAARGHRYLQKPLDIGLFLKALDAALTLEAAPAQL